MSTAHSLADRLSVADLARRLGVPVERIIESARTARLPFSILNGEMFVDAQDVALWSRALERDTL
jgi:hypothetical protein